jgi:hypothetical protein
MTLLSDQYAPTAPSLEGTAEATSPLLLPRRAADRLSHFSPEIYDLGATSHLSRLLKVLLGDAGIGAVRKRMLMARLQQTLQGSHFIDLDRFYGALFGMRRRAAELLTAEAQSGSATPDQWQQEHSKDASYRSRIEQFARAISFGATPTGMELVAEALLNVDCNVFESFSLADINLQTYGSIEAEVGTYGGAEAFTYGELEALGLVSSGISDRWYFIVRPKREITPEERYDVQRTISRLKPAFARCIVDANGVVLHEEGGIRGLTADSEYWEIRAAVAPKPGQERFYAALPYGDGAPVVQPKPPFSQYQGEAWSYNGDIIGVVGYSKLGATVWPGSDRTRLTYVKRALPYLQSYVDLIPSLSLQGFQDTEAGRVASDAILVAYPLSLERGSSASAISTPGPFGGEFGTVASGWRRWRRLSIDSIPLYTIEPWQRTDFAPNELTQMWATTERPISDLTQEVVEYRYASPRYINNFQCEVSRYPHTFSFEIWDMETGDWRSVYRNTVRDAVPGRLEHDAVIYGPYVAQHVWNTHWMRLGQKIDPVSTDRVRIVMQRFPSGIGPVDARGVPTPYSLALRKVDVGYRIYAHADLPRDLTTIAQTRDILGSVKVMAKHEEKASDLLIGKQWRSEPQPVPYAVVNLYADTRDDLGDGQIFERFFVDPIYQGIHVTLYHSSEEPTGTFTASDDQLPLGVISVIGNVIWVADGLNLAGPDVSYVEIPNSATLFDATKPWSAFMEFVPHWTSAVDTHEIISWGENRIYVADDQVHFVTENGPELTVTAPFPGFQRVRIGWSYGPGQKTLVVQRDTMPEVTATLALASPAEDTTTVTTHIRIGAQDSVTPGMSDFLLTALMVKQGVVLGEEALSDGLWDMPNFVRKPRFENDDDGSTDNAVLRWHIDYVTPTNFYGFVGGPGDFYAALHWRPVARDFILQRGFIAVPPIKAKFWKFEFTNLAVQPYESFVPINRQIKTFPLRQARAVWSGLSDGRTAIGYRTNATLFTTPSYRFTDTVSAATGVQVTDTTLDGTSRTVTSAIYIQNAQVAQRVGNWAWLYNFLPSGQGTKAPTFTQDGQHEYDLQVVSHAAKVAFFVGLKELKGYRLLYTADDDTTQYRDLFYDDHNIESSTWEQDPNRLYTDDVGLPSVATSKVFESGHPIIGLQFATQQNEPVQIMPDDEFRDPALIDYAWDDDALWHRFGDADISYDAGATTVTVNRESLAGIIDVSVMGVGIEQPVVHPVFSSTTPISNPEEAMEHLFGGVESPLVTLSAEGRIHAAVRFTVEKDLSRPVTLQIITADGTVLASKDITAIKGQTIEEFVSYTINSYVPDYQTIESPFEPPRTIVDRPVQPPGTDPELTMSAGGGAGDTTGDDAVRVRLIQYGATSDSWVIDTMSLFDESIVWEFSNDGGENWLIAYGVRNFVNGVLMFERPGAALQWRVTGYRANMNITSLQIRPWYRNRPNLRTAGHFRGPNLSTFDHEPPIQNDPEFSLWYKPVPRTWFLAGRSYPSLPIDSAVPRNEFSNFFGRATNDDLSDQTDEATRQLVANRYGYTIYHGDQLPHEDPGGEFLSVPIDEATRAATMARAGSEALSPVTDAASAFTYDPDEDPINRGLVAPPD